jgi:CO/xanthine dehydrogenase FAD-binding subunit
MKIKDFIIPATLEEARGKLKELGDEALPLAGGTAMPFFSEASEKIAVDITRIGLTGIRKEKGGFGIGAATTLADLAGHRDEGWVLDEVAGRVATQQIRNVSTIGGNIARVFAWADFPVALLALDATMTILGDSEQALTAGEFFKSQPARLFRGGGLLTNVRVPAVGGRGAGFGYHKETRTGPAFSMMTAAALVELDGGKIARARLAAGAAISFPRRLEGVEERLAGRPAGEAEIEKAVSEGAKDIPWKGREGMSDEYASHLARVILQDVLVQAVRRAEGGGR